MNKMTKIAISAVCVAGISAFAVSNFNFESADAADPKTNAFSEFKKEQSVNKSESEKAFLKINQKEYSKKAYNEFKQSQNLIKRSNNLAPATEEQTKQEFIQSKVVEDAAEQQKIEVTDVEAKEFANQIRQQIAASDDTNGKQFLKDYINALGISEDQYWNEYAVKGYKHALKVSKLKEQYIKTLNIKEDENYLDNVNNAWGNYEKELVKKSKVETIQ